MKCPNDQNDAHGAHGDDDDDERVVEAHEDEEGIHKKDGTHKGKVGIHEDTRNAEEEEADHPQASNDRGDWEVNQERFLHVPSEGKANCQQRRPIRDPSKVTVTTWERA